MIREGVGGTPWRSGPGGIRARRLEGAEERAVRNSAGPGGGGRNQAGPLPFLAQFPDSAQFVRRHRCLRFVEDDDVSRRPLQGRLRGRIAAQPPRMAGHAQLWKVPGQLVGDLLGLIRRAVVDDQQFKPGTQVGEDVQRS